MNRSVGEERIGGDIFVPTIDIGSRLTIAIVFAKRATRSIPCELCSRLDGLLDALDWQPTEVGAKSFKIGGSLGNGALMNATFQEIRHIVAVLTFLKFSSTLMNNDEVHHVLFNIPSIFTNVIDTRILVAMISRRIKLERGRISM